jgi:hypothetical protein
MMRAKLLLGLLAAACVSHVRVPVFSAAKPVVQ